MKAVFENQIQAKDQIIFKRDLLLYMILLSALVKSNSYLDEKEIRIIYFSIDKGNKIEEEYEQKMISDQKCIRPYIEFNGLKFGKAVESILISPLAKNVPIEDDLYKEVISNFVDSKLKKQDRDYSENTIEISISKHKCRW